MTPARWISRFRERLAFRSGESVLPHTWQADAGTSTVKVTVFVNGQPQVDASVVLIRLEHITDVAGKASFPAIPSGRHTIEGRFAGSEHLLSKRVAFTAADGQPVEVRIDLEPPPETLRLVRMTGTLDIMDHENVGSNEHGSFSIDKFCRVDPFQITNGAEASHCVGDEVKVKVRMTCHLATGDLGPPGSVIVEVAVEMFEGTDCDTDDLDDSDNHFFLLTPEATKMVTFDLRNDSDLDGGDTATHPSRFSNGRRF